MTTSPKTKGFQNLSSNPAEAEKERAFATGIEGLMAESGVPQANQLHIISLVSADLSRTVAESAQG